MSQVYTLEPPTQGKVVLHTTLGELDVELWPKEAPRAVRNFVQLCMEGAYDGTIFHRKIKDYLVQGGDPTGTGDGGESIYGHPFRDEYHSRLKFSHRGLIACANQNAPDTNGAQFFITFDRAEHLTRKATIFGKITGDTVYNLMRFNDLETGDADRPVDPPKVVKAEVVWSPFDDIVPRVSRAAKEAAETAAKAEETKRTARKGTKNFKLISFGEEAEEEAAAEEAAAAELKIKSAHDALDEERLSKQAGVEVDLSKVREAMRAAKTAAAEEEPAVGSGGAKIRGRMAFKKRAAPEPAAPAGGGFVARVEEKTGGAAAIREDRRVGNREEEERVEEEEDSGDEEESKKGGRSRKRGRLDALRQRPGKGGKVSAAVVAPSRQAPEADALLTKWESKRQGYKERKRLGGAREKDTMSKLQSFLGKIGSKKGGEVLAVEEEEEGGVGLDERGAAATGEETAAGYDGKVADDIDHRAYMPAAWRVDSYLEEGGEEGGEDEDLGLDALRGHTLNFGGGKSVARDHMARKEGVDDYVVLDPLLEAGKAKFNRQQQKHKKRGREWAGRSMD